jgi:Fe-S-cluster containining protein
MPDQIIRDLPRIARYARHNEEQDYRFRDYLKNELAVPDAELDASVRGITDAVWSQIECTSCAHCCKRLQIVVDDRDIRRLADRLKMAVGAFKARYVAVAADKVKHFVSSPCPFLGDDGFCTVYEDRPQACRDFPYLHDAGFRSRSLTMVENVGFCPIVFNVWQELKQRYQRRKK